MMNKEELLSQQLYFMKSNLTEAPHFVNSEFFVLFTNQALAASFSQSVSKRLRPYYHSVGNNPVVVCAITDNDSFFQEMMSIGFSKFSFNGEGKIFDLNTIYERENKLSEEEKELYIYYMGHIKMQKSTHIGRVKTQKIQNAKLYLNSDNNPEMVQRFVKSQEKLKLCYKSISIINPPLKDPNSFTPTMPILEKNMEEAKQTIPPPYVEKTDIVSQQGKKSRPIVSVIMFILAAMFALAFIGVKKSGDFPEIIAYGVAAISYFILGILMTKKYLKSFGWAIISVLFLINTIGNFFSARNTPAISCLLFTIISGGLFVFANRNNRVG